MLYSSYVFNPINDIDTTIRKEEIYGILMHGLNPKEVRLHWIKRVIQWGYEGLKVPHSSMYLSISVIVDICINTQTLQYHQKS